VKKYLLLVALFVLIGNILDIGLVKADWAYPFVVNDGKTYIITDTRVEPSQIDSKIGQVTSYSDREGTYSGNFSNYFSKGTEYYSIKGIDINEAIAVRTSEEIFIQSNYQGEYGGSKMDWRRNLPYLVGLILFVIIVFING